MLRSRFRGRGTVREGGCTCWFFRVCIQRSAANRWLRRDGRGVGTGGHVMQCKGDSGVYGGGYLCRSSFSCTRTGAAPPSPAALRAGGSISSRRQHQQQAGSTHTSSSPAAAPSQHPRRDMNGAASGIGCRACFEAARPGPSMNHTSPPSIAYRARVGPSPCQSTMQIARATCRRSCFARPNVVSERRTPNAS